LRVAEHFQSALAFLTQEGLDAPTLRAYRLLFGSVDLACQYRLTEAADALRESASTFASSGHRLHVEWAQRILMTLFSDTEPLPRDQPQDPGFSWRMNLQVHRTNIQLTNVQGRAPHTARPIKLSVQNASM
jgi:hypothetical protein